MAAYLRDPESDWTGNTEKFDAMVLRRLLRESLEALEDLESSVRKKRREA